MASFAGKPVKVKFYLENAELFSYGFKSDSTPPVTQSEVQGTKQTSWYTDDVTVTLSAADDFSGVDHTEYSLDGGQSWHIYSTPIRITEEGRHPLLYRSKDGAGNGEAVQAADIPIDKTPPDIQITGAAIYTVDQQVRIACTAGDTVSGVVYSSCSSPLVDSPAYRLGIGTHRVEAVAVDEAGHRMTEAAEYEIQASVPSMIRLLKQWAGEGLNAGVANSLMGKLEHGQTDAFLHEVSAQKGKKLSDEQAEALAAMALALTSQPNGMGPDNPA
ncbi:hypothetical protein N6H14_21590 [Paenibacillus sp. CC-CFT747]|nr:hypothetical protein N6H14_21590 [Paenibacillus sp. CC-CFT747]